MLAGSLASVLLSSDHPADGPDSSFMVSLESDSPASDVLCGVSTWKARLYHMCGGWVRRRAGSCSGGDSGAPGS